MTTLPKLNPRDFAAVNESGIGPKPKCRNVRDLVANGWKADTTRTYRPPAYGIAEIVVSNQEAYAKEFLPVVRKTIADAGGKFLAAGGKTVSLQGAPPAPRVVLIQWESLDKAQDWWNSQATKDAFALGEKYATFRNYSVEGVTP